MNYCPGTELPVSETGRAGDIEHRYITPCPSPRSCLRIQPVESTYQESSLVDPDSPNQVFQPSSPAQPGAPRSSFTMKTALALILVPLGGVLAASSLSCQTLAPLKVHCCASETSEIVETVLPSNTVMLGCADDFGNG